MFINNLLTTNCNNLCILCNLLLFFIIHYVFQLNVHYDTTIKTLSLKSNRHARESNITTMGNMSTALTLCFQVLRLW